MLLPSFERVRCGARGEWECAETAEGGVKKQCREILTKRHLSMETDETLIIVFLSLRASTQCEPMTRNKESTFQRMMTHPHPFLATPERGEDTPPTPIQRHVEAGHPRRRTAWGRRRRHTRDFTLSRGGARGGSGGCGGGGACPLCIMS